MIEGRKEAAHFLFAAIETICTFSIIHDIMIIWTQLNFYDHDSIPLPNNFVILCLLSINPYLVSLVRWMFDSVDVPHPIATFIHYYPMDPYVNKVMTKCRVLQKNKITKAKKAHEKWMIKLKKSWKYEEKLDCWAIIQCVNNKWYLCDDQFLGCTHRNDHPLTLPQCVYL